MRLNQIGYLLLEISIQQGYVGQDGLEDNQSGSNIDLLSRKLGHKILYDHQNYYFHVTHF